LIKLVNVLNNVENSRGLNVNYATCTLLINMAFAENLQCNICFKRNKTYGHLQALPS